MTDELVSWIDADGAEHSLGPDSSVALLVGREDWWMPEFDFAADPVPFQPGARLRQVSAKPREPALPLLLRAESYDALWQLRKDVLGWFDPTRGDGYLRVTDPQGEQRELAARAVSGLGLREKWPDSSPTHQHAVVTLRAYEPYWQDTEEQEQAFGTPQTAVWFPIFPLNLASSSVFSNPVVDNNGDVEAWPVWTITGPGSNPVLANQTTGKSISLTLTLAAGEQVIIDTRPGEKSVTNAVGASLFPYLSSTSELWPLARGVNLLAVTVASSTSATSVSLRYKRRWLGP